MRPAIVSLISTVQISRLAHAFAGVASLWFVILWVRAAQDLEPANPTLHSAPLWVLLGLAAAIGVGMSTYAGALNDVFDFRRDQTFAPSRPIPAGRVSVRSATIVGFSSLIVSMLAASTLGAASFLTCVFCASSILFYNTTARHVPSLGLLTVALIYGSHMLIVSPGMRFIWPVLLVMIHAAAVNAAVYRLEEKRPKLTVLTAIGFGIGYLLLALAVVYQAGHEGPLWRNAYEWYGLVWPAFAVTVFIYSAFSKARFASSPTFAAEKLQRYGSLWIGLYGVAWLLGGALYRESLILGLLVTLGILWMIFVRDLGAWIEQPVGYRW
ncbi:MAG: UbiA family prenyltransferase [Phycisphaerales bacterium]